MTTCNEYRTALSELADGSLAGEARARVEAHIQECADCRTVLADIRRLRQAARSLPKATPPEDLWNKVRARIDEDTHPRVVPFGRSRWMPHSRATWGMLAAAAVLLLAVSAGIVTMVRQQGVPASQSAQAPAAMPAAAPEVAAAHGSSGDLVQSIEMELDQAILHYEKAAAGIEQVAREGRGALDPQTASVLQKNAGILDQAILESRAALKTDPNSEPARASLFDALRQKVDLLQETVSLINEMRKGNQAGAAEIVGGKQ